MSVNLSASQVLQALEPLLGTRFVTSTPLCENAAAALRQFDPQQMQLTDMFALVKDAIFSDLYATLGQGMLLQLENGVRLRLRLRDIDTLADEALGTLLDVLPLPVLTLGMLRDYAMQTGSLCAMRVMLQRYGNALAPMEQEMLIRIIRENYPPDRYQHWLQA